MSNLPKRLRIKAGMIQLGEIIAWGSDAEIMEEAADEIDRLKAVPMKYKRMEHNAKLQAEVDVLALNAAREIMGLVYGPTPLGGSPQLLAQIQCVVSEAIVYAAPQPVSDDAVIVPRELLDRFPEINMANFGADEVNLLNDWGIEVSLLGGDPPAYDAIDAAIAKHKEQV